MKIDPNCRLCGMKQLDRAFPQYYKTPLWESERFFAVPSVGSIVPGWLLVIPRDHILRAADLAPAVREELIDFVQFVRRQLISRFGPTCIFEHGPARRGCATGCSVDHAHLHLVPTSTDLIHKSGDFIPAPPVIKLRGFAPATEAAARLAMGCSYLLAVDADDSAALWIAADFQSQLFRRVISAAHGVPREFDWRLFPRDDVARTTIERIGRADMSKTDFSKRHGEALAARALAIHGSYGA